MTANNHADHDDSVIMLDTHVAVPLCCDLDMLEDWLLHCSADTLDELGNFAYRATNNPQFGVTELITALGRYGVVLRRLLAAQRAQQR
ncbi:hypothetical protein [Haloechinothrix salitolerans]|uniref:Uncharacterized protein n=1 Tax=Haloechinothrix salitolerans TaxID=926830 RepID=A0ABW2BZC8_9PSEU